jgi:anti-anti-sigma factor
MDPDFNVHLNISDGIAVLALQGRFDFSQYSVFKEEQTQVLDSAGVHSIVLDFDQLQYLDSAALGVLLVLLDRAKELNKTVSIRRANGIVKEILDVAHFDRMFEIED